MGMNKRNRQRKGEYKQELFEEKLLAGVIEEEFQDIVNLRSARSGLS
jgi:hypothetical protein